MFLNPTQLLTRVLFPVRLQAFTPPLIATTSPATQASQVSSFGALINNAVQGSVAIIQAIKRPAAVYQPGLAGVEPGGTGAAQAPQPSLGVPTWTFWALGGALVAVFLAAVLAAVRR